MLVHTSLTMAGKARPCDVSSCAFFCIGGSAIFSDHASFTMVGEARPYAIVLGVPLFVETVLRAF